MPPRSRRPTPESLGIEAYRPTDVPEVVVNSRQPLIVAVDPGDEHVGTAVFTPDGRRTEGHRVVCVQEYTPDDWLDVMAYMLIAGKMKTLVYERFLLDGALAREQTGSEFVTVQLIGVMRWMVRKQNEHAHEHYRAKYPMQMSCVRAGQCSVSAVPQPVDLVAQLRTIKTPTRKILNRRNIKSLSAQVGASDHCKDAEMHGWHWLLNETKGSVEERPSLGLRRERHRG